MYRNVQMELDRVQGESEKLSLQLEAMNDELVNKKEIVLERENDIKHLNNQQNKINERLTNSEAARSKAEEMYRNVQMDLRDKNSTIDELKAQVAHLESNITQEKEATYTNETQYRDQIIERNILLITTFQYLDTIMSDGNSKQSNYPKPSDNFPLFHERLLSKLKTLSHVHNTFERRAKEIDTRWQEQYEALKNQLEIKLRQINKFEGIVQKANVAAKDWRERAKKNQGELEAARNTNEELIEQLSTMREQLEELRTVKVQAEEVEAKLREAERRTRTLEVNIKDEERRWDAKCKELESKGLHAEEKLKIEKQGAREKVESFRETVKDLEAQLQAQARRNSQLQELLDLQKAQMEATSETKAITAKAENTLSQLNEQLREQLEEKNKYLDLERERLKNIEEQNQKLIDQIERREATITKVLNSLQLLNQRKELMDNAAFRQVTEEIQSTIDGHRRIGYQPPAFINPPWKPAGSGIASKSPPPMRSSSIPTLSSTSKLKKSVAVVDTAKPVIPTRLPSLNIGSSSGIATSNQRGSIPRPTKDTK